MSVSVASDTGDITTGSDSIVNSLNKSGSEKLPEILDGKYFKVTKKDTNGHVEAKCMECFKTGLVQKYQGSIHAISNFTTHLKRKHPAALQSYTEYMKTAEAKAKRVKQTCLPFPIINTTSHLQSKTERLILNFVVQTMQPLSIVDDEAFKKLVTGLNSEAKVMCRQTLTKMVSCEYQSRFSALKKTLGEVEWLCATADIWSSRHRSFMGLTIHWLTEDLKRKSAILALQRFQGVHSNDKIAEMLVKIFESFNVSNKIVNVVTDNGSNFVKAFKVYSIDTAIQRSEDDDGNKSEMESEEEEDIREVDFPELEDTGIVLPPHLRCASHTINLIMTQNLEKVTKGRDKAKSQFKKLLRDSFSKCHAVWNKVGRSVKSSEIVRNLLGKSLIKPVATRWNSTFDAVTRLLVFRDKLDAMFEVLGVTNLNPLEVEFLVEYKMAVAPVAWALDKLQAENECYLGHLAPVLLKTYQRLDDIVKSKSENTFGWIIAECLKDGLRERFTRIFDLDTDDAKQEILATVTLPWFKLRWIPKGLEAKRTEIKSLMIREALKFYKPGDSAQRYEVNAWSDLICEDSVQLEDNSDAESAVELECLKYLQDSADSIAGLTGYPTVKSMSVKLNTPLPSSAPAERLFSYAGMVLRPKRSNLSDELFEQLVLLKLNFKTPN